MARAFIGIGSNLGDRPATLAATRQALSQLPQSTLTGWSQIYETAPVGPVPQGKYLNAAAALETALEPLVLLGHLSDIEERSGRLPQDQRIKWGPRTLDLDVLLYGDLVISKDELVIPHPLMHERWFVLKPLADLDAGVVHPLLEMTVGELLKYVDQDEQGAPAPLQGQSPSHPPSDESGSP